MKIQIKDILDKKEYLNNEILNSIDNVEIINEAIEKGYYDVKLLINGHELEPKFFNLIMNTIENFIEDEAKKIVKDKLEEASEKANQLQNLVDDVRYKIIENFNLD